MVRFVVVNLDTTSLDEKFYERYGDANRRAIKLNGIEKPYGKYACEWVAYEYEFWLLYIRHQETVTNLLSGKSVVQWSDTPLCCDPSSETYHSM